MIPSYFDMRQYTFFNKNMQLLSLKFIYRKNYILLTNFRTADNIHIKDKKEVAVMAHNSKEDIIRLVEGNDVEFIRLQFTDIFGILKNVAVPKSQLEKALNNQMMFDGSSIDGFARIEESDMCLSSSKTKLGITKVPSINPVWHKSNILPSIITDVSKTLALPLA